MPRSHLSNYLRTKRLRSGFTQRELGELFGMSRSAVAYAEGVRPPPLELLLMTEIVFGSSQRELFPGIYARLEHGLMMRALAMEHRLIGSDNSIARKKCAFLGELIKRAQANASKL